MSLQRALATRDFRPELVALPWGLIPPDRPQTPPAAPHRQSLETPPPAAVTPPTPQTQGLSRNQEAEQNPHPAPQMQIGPGFSIRTAIDEAEANRVNIPLKDYSCHFFLSYHLKGVCKTHFGGRNLHRTLSQSEFGRLGE